MSHVIVEVATERTALEVSDLVLEVFTAFAGSFSPTALMWSPRAVREAAAEGEWLSARVDGSVVGAVHHTPDPEGLTRDPRGYTLDGLAVRESERRRGIGSLLVARVEDHAAQLGAQTVVVTLRRTLSPNSRLFGGRGYQALFPYSETAEHDVWVKELGSDLGSTPCARSALSGLHERGN